MLNVICVPVSKKKVGIVICDRYRDCAGGKCLRSLRNREGAFNLYKNEEIELVGYTTCGGCPGGNVEYCIEEMKKNGAEIVHFATGMLVGYPPCPHIDHFDKFVRQKYGVDVVIGTHPIPQSYYITHAALGTWDSPDWKEKIKHVLTDEPMRLKYS
jgi:predicted metal-binding protein